MADQNSSFEGARKRAETAFSGTEKDLKDLHVPEGDLTAKGLDDLIAKIIDEGGLKTYEQLAVYNDARTHRDRIRQQQERGKRPAQGVERDRERTSAYVSTFTEYYPGSVKLYLDTMKKYTALKDQYGLHDKPDLLAMEQQYVPHLEMVAQLLHDRLAIGRFRVLQFLKQDRVQKVGGEPIAVAIENARKNLPKIVKSRAPLKPTDDKKTDQPITINTAANDASDASLEEASLILDRDISWMTSDEEIQGKKPPGVSQAGVSPADIMYVQGLQSADDVLGDEEYDIADRGKEREKLAALHQRRLALRQEKFTYMHSLGPKGRMMKLKTVREMFGRQYGPGIPGERAKEWPFTPAEYVMNRQTFDAEVMADIGKFNSHFDEMLKDGGAFSKTWDTHAEQAWNKFMAPFAVFLAEKYVFLESIPRHLAARLPYVPDDLGTRHQNHIMHSLREAYGLPEDFDFSTGAVEQLRKEHPEKARDLQKNIQDAMRSVNDAIDAYQPLIKESVRRSKEDLALLPKLMSHVHPDDVLNAVPDMQSLLNERNGYVVNGRLTDKILTTKDPAIIAAAYDYFFDVQLEKDWSSYVSVCDEYAGELEKIIQSHFNKMFAWEEFRQGVAADWRQILAYMLAYVYGGHGRVARKLPLLFKPTVMGIPNPTSLVTRPTVGVVDSAASDAWNMGKRIVKGRPVPSAAETAGRTFLSRQKDTAKFLTFTAGPAVALEALNAYWVIKNDLPELLYTSHQASAALTHNEHEVAQALTAQYQLQAIETAYRLASGPVYYTVAKTVGPKIAMGATLGAEALIAEAKFIQSSIADDVLALRTSETDARSMSKADIIVMLEKYQPGSRTSGQVVRTWSLSGLTHWVTSAEFEKENEVVRENFLSAYLFRRFLQKAKNHEPFALKMGVQMYTKHGRETPEFTVVWNKYVQSVQEYLKQKYGTRNNLYVIPGGKWEQVLQEADSYAEQKTSVQAYQQTLHSIGELAPRIAAQFAEIQKLNLVADSLPSGSKEYANALRQREERLRTLQPQAQAFAALMGTKEHFAILTTGILSGAPANNGSSIEALALKADGSLRDITSAEMKNMLASNTNFYRHQWELSLPGSERLKESLHEYVNRTTDLLENEAIKQPWFLNQHTFDALLEYAFFLDAHPVYDPQNILRSQIRSLPAIQWDQNFGDAGANHPYWNQFVAVRETIKKYLQWNTTERVKGKKKNAA